MGLRAYYYVQSQFGSNFKVMIYQDGYGAAAQELNGAAPGFKLSYKGDEDQVLDPIRTSGCDLYIALNTTAVGVVNQVIAKQESTFKVEILEFGVPAGDESYAESYYEYESIATRAATFSDAEAETRFNTGTLAKVLWRGVILNDAIELPNQSNDSNAVVVLSCSDGLGRLKESKRELTRVNSISGGGVRTSIIEGILDILQDTNITDLWNSDEPLVRASAYWYADTMNTDDDPLDQQSFAQRKFVYSINEKSQEVTYTDLYEVLKQLLNITGLRLIQSGGTFQLQSATQQQEESMKFFCYSSNYKSTGVPNVADTGYFYQIMRTSAIWTDTIDRTTRPSPEDRQPLAGGKFLFRPAFKQVLAVHDVLGTVQFDVLAQQSIGLASFFSTGWDIPSEGLSGTLQLKNQFTFSTAYVSAGGTIPNTSANPVGVSYALEAQIKIGSYYWDKLSNSWGTSAVWNFVPTTNWEVAAQIIGTSTATTTLRYFGAGIQDPSVITFGPTVSTGEVELKMQGTIKGWQLDAGGSRIIDQVSPSGNSNTAFAKLTLYSDGDSVNLEYSAENGDSDQNSSFVYDFGTLHIGNQVTDASGRANQLMVWDAGVSEWTYDYQGFRYLGSVDNYVRLHELMVTEAMRLQQQPKRLFDSLVGGDYYPHKVLSYNFDSADHLFVLLSGDLDGHSGIWRGLWYEIATDRTNTPPTGVVPSLPVFSEPAFGSFGGGFGGSMGGWLGGLLGSRKPIYTDESESETLNSNSPSVNDTTLSVPTSGSVVPGVYIATFNGSLEATSSNTIATLYVYRNGSSGAIVSASATVTQFMLTAGAKYAVSIATPPFNVGSTDTVSVVFTVDKTCDLEKASLVIVKQ